MLCMFEIPGKPVGFIAQWGKQSWTKKREYMEWCQQIRMIASCVAGWRFPDATKNLPLYIHTRAFFKNGTHPDPENIHKAVVDALMYGLKCKDKYTGGCFLPPLYDKVNPRVEVVIEDGRKPIRETIPESWNACLPDM